MEMVVQEIDGGITAVNLSGRLDIAGAAKIDLRFSALSGSRRSIMVDLSEVTFLASMGIRLILVSAKAVKSKGGKLVLVGPDAEVMKVLETAGIDMMIPVCRDRDAALASLVS